MTRPTHRIAAKRETRLPGIDPASPAHVLFPSRRVPVTAAMTDYARASFPAGRPRLRGADASHAWVSVWCGEAWYGLDPTNDCAVRDDHIELGVGRDDGDVTPIDGIVSAPGAQRLQVEVDVVPDGEPMP